MTASELRLVPLTTVDEETLRGRTAELTAAIRQFHVQGTGYELRVSAVDEVVEFLAWLWDAVADPVPRHTGLGTGTSSPRLWWVPTGPFAQLPLHAAGLHDGPDGHTAWTVSCPPTPRPCSSSVCSTGAR